MKAKQPGEKSAGAFRTISEVAGELNVEQHVLRFWETKFNQIKPLKRGGGRRYYRPEDIELLKNIHHLLYNEGYTIKGVQKLLTATRGNLTPRVQDGPEVLAAEPEAVSPVTRAVEQNRDELEQMLAELKSMRKLID
ncbi:MAG TPA: MerR family transcriptional regulator [Alphaproteobacteria bacterium]|nr:MerR family transcriptional regulator [Alphaproteobacteria bacterium]